MINKLENQIESYKTELKKGQISLIEQNNEQKKKIKII